MDGLVKFARENHESFSLFSDEQIYNFFRNYAPTTIIRTGPDGITGFCVYRFLDGFIDIFAVAVTGERSKNYRDMRQYLRTFFKGHKVRLRAEKGHKWVLKQL